MSKANEHNVYLVPESSDGSFFHPGLKRRKGYQIGPKGNEVYILDYLDALKKLKAMKVPFWRRPSKTSGTYGVVKGITWKKMLKE